MVLFVLMFFCTLINIHVGDMINLVDPTYQCRQVGHGLHRLLLLVGEHPGCSLPHLKRVQDVLDDRLD